MRESILHLNYIAVLVVTVVGFMLGWAWFSPLLFAKAWVKEMKLTEEDMAKCAKEGMGKYLVQGFLFTLLSTFGLAVLLGFFLHLDWMRGAIYGAFFGLFGPAMRMLNAGVWERASLKLQAIRIGHEVVLYALQGALLAIWH